MTERWNDEEGVPPQLRPLDASNRALRDNVHPPGWADPEPAERYHLLVIGAGTAGLVSAAIAAGLGARVALVERHLMGGDCLNVGCVPSKAMLRAARAWAEARGAAARFGGPAVSGEGDFAAAMARMRSIRADISRHDSAARFRDLGVDVFLGDARFAGPDSAQVGGRTLRFRRAVIATGGRPAPLEVPGLREEDYLTNETVFSLTTLPRRMLIVGGGPIGCEMAQAFARFGARVTLLEARERILAHDDAEAAEVVRGALLRDGVEVVTRAEVLAAERRGEERVLRVRTPEGVGERVGGELLVAAGRLPNVEGLGLEAAGVRTGRRGVETDERLRTSNPRIFAVGDVNGLHPFTHAADAQARLAVQNALFFGRKKVSELVVPWCTYTDPELAQVGIGAEEAVRRGGEVESVTVPLDSVDRARLDGATSGFLRVHLARGDQTVLGATVVGEHAGELIGILAAAMTTGVGLDRLGATIFPYPTLSEAVRKAADARRRERLTPRAKRAFELFFRATR